MDFDVLKDQAIQRGLALNFGSPENAAGARGGQKLFALKFNLGTIIFWRKPVTNILKLLKFIAESTNFTMEMLLNFKICQEELAADSKYCPIWENFSEPLSPNITLRQWLLENDCSSQDLEG